MNIALISYHTQEKYTAGTDKDEHTTLLDYLLAKGLSIESVIWNDPKVNWEDYDLAILKTPWDYHDHFADFNIWLNKLEALGVSLLNPYDIIRWNSDKHYLKEIADAGLKIIPSQFLEQGSTLPLQVFFDSLAVEKLIIKPCVSAGAKNTLILTKEDIVTSQNVVDALLQIESYIVQPYMEEIQNGELSFIFLGGEFSHSVLKLPGEGDFRVQHYHGGTIQATEKSSQGYILAAQAYIKKFAAGCLYARVDGLIVNGIFHLMELELIEPYLFLSNHPEAFFRYYETLLDLLPQKDHVTKNQLL